MEDPNHKHAATHTHTRARDRLKMGKVPVSALSVTRLFIYFHRINKPSFIDIKLLKLTQNHGTL